MPRATAAQRAQRLNRSRTLLQVCSSLSEAVQQLVRSCAISTRQAYRYLKQAERLKHPVPINRPKIAFTVKLPPAQVRQLRIYAARNRLTLSDIVSRALTVMLDRGRRRGGTAAKPAPHVAVGISVRSLTGSQAHASLRIVGARPAVAHT